MNTTNKMNGYFFFVNPKEKTVKLYKGLDFTKKGQGFWYAANQLPEEYESWINLEDEKIF